MLHVNIQVAVQGFVAVLMKYYYDQTFFVLFHSFSK